MVIPIAVADILLFDSGYDSRLAPRKNQKSFRS